MDEKIKEIEFDILPQNYLNSFKAIKHIEYLLSKVKELEELEKGLRNAIECDGQTIKRWEELFEHSQSKVKELEKAGFNLMDYTKKLGHDLEVAHALRDVMRIKANIAEAKVKELEENELRFPTMAEFSNLQEDYERVQTKVKKLEEGIQEILNTGYISILDIESKLIKLVEKERE